MQLHKLSAFDHFYFIFIAGSHHPGRKVLGLPTMASGAAIFAGGPAGSSAPASLGDAADARTRTPGARFTLARGSAERIAATRERGGAPVRSVSLSSAGFLAASAGRRGWMPGATLQPRAESPLPRAATVLALLRPSCPAAGAKAAKSSPPAAAAPTPDSAAGGFAASGPFREGVLGHAVSRSPHR